MKNKKIRKSPINIGDKFGDLIVIKQLEHIEYGKTKQRISMWRLRCECGNIINASIKKIRQKLFKHCGCKGTISYRNAEDRIGEQYNDFTVLSIDRKEKRKNNYHVYYKCQCKCGQISIMERTTLGKHKHCHRCYSDSRMGKPYKDISHRYWECLKITANKRNIKFNISKKYAWEIFINQNKLCALSGVPLRFEKRYTKQRTLQTASLDRIDSDLSYEIGNVQWVHKQVNWLKSSLKDEDLLRWVKLIYEHNNMEEIS